MPRTPTPASCRACNSNVHVISASPHSSPLRRIVLPKPPPLSSDARMWYSAWPAVHVQMYTVAYYCMTAQSVSTALYSLELHIMKSISLARRVSCAKVRTPCGRQPHTALDRALHKQGFCILYMFLKKFEGRAQRSEFVSSRTRFCVMRTSRRPWQQQPCE